MNILPTTIALLTLLAIAGYATTQQTSHTLQLLHLAEQTTRNHREADAQRQLLLFHAGVKLNPRFPDKSPKPKGGSGSKPTPRPKTLDEIIVFPARLNLHPLTTHSDRRHRDLLQTTLAHLIADLYPQHAPLAQTLAAEIAQQLQSAKTPPRYIEELAALDLPPSLHTPWLEMLDDSLLDYLALSPKEKTINLAFAPPPILHALFENPTIVASILAKRQSLIETYNAQKPDIDLDKTTRRDLALALQTHTNELLKSHHLTLAPSLSFDFTYKPSILALAENKEHFPIPF